MLCLDRQAEIIIRLGCRNSLLKFPPTLLLALCWLAVACPARAQVYSQLEDSLEDGNFPGLPAYGPEVGINCRF